MPRWTGAFARRRTGPHPGRALARPGDRRARTRRAIGLRRDILASSSRSLDYHSRTVRCQNDPQLPAVVVPPRTFPKRLRKDLRGLVKVPHPAMVAKDFELLGRQRAQLSRTPVVLDG